ncbi:MAG: sugar phosphate isomerase/epimerase family protein [Litoreibacter sp.]
MQLGINFLCATGFVDAGHRDLLEAAVSAGFDGVEIPVLDGTPDQYAVLALILDELGLKRTCTAIVPSPDADPTSADASIRKKGAAHLNWITDCALALGAETIGGPFHAPLGHFTGKGPQPDELQHGADAHRVMAERVATHNIKLALEPLNRFETHYLNTAAQARAYCDLVDHPAFGIMYDTFHSHIEEKDQPRAVQTLSGHINVLHVSENDRGIPGTGQIDFPSILSAVKETGFDGWVVVEAFGSGVPELAAATRIWRPMFEGYDSLFNQSAAFIKDVWAQT